MYSLCLYPSLPTQSREYVSRLDGRRHFALKAINNQTNDTPAKPLNFLLPEVLPVVVIMKAQTYVSLACSSHATRTLTHPLVATQSPSRTLTHPRTYLSYTLTHFLAWLSHA
jgi:hypothetical protein